MRNQGRAPSHRDSLLKNVHDYYYLGWPPAATMRQRQASGNHFFGLKLKLQSKFFMLLGSASAAALGTPAPPPPLFSLCPASSPTNPIFLQSSSSA